MRFFAVIRDRKEKSCFNGVGRSEWRVEWKSLSEASFLARSIDPDPDRMNDPSMLLWQAKARPKKTGYGSDPHRILDS